MFEQTHVHSRLEAGSYLPSHVQPFGLVRRDNGTYSPVKHAHHFKNEPYNTIQKDDSLFVDQYF